MFGKHRFKFPRNLVFYAGIVFALMNGQHAGSAGSEARDFFVYVGNYGKGIAAFRFHADTAKVEPMGVAGDLADASFLAADAGHRFLYAVSELKGNVNGAVAAFAINRHSGQLKFLNSTSSGGVAPCHLAVDKTGKVLTVANYTSGTVSAYPIEPEGHIGPAATFFTTQGRGPNAKRQEGPHMHETVFSADNRFVYVPDLGLDRVHIFSVDTSTAKLTLLEHFAGMAKPGYGPRHIAFSPDKKYAYVVNELKSFVTVYAHDPRTGALDEVQELSTLPANFHGENGPAEVEVDRSGKYLYTSNRGPGTIAVFAIDQHKGTLTQIQIAETKGTWPRGMALDPTGQFLFAGDEKANRFVLFRVDPQSGNLTLTDQIIETPSPVAFLFVPAE